MSTTAGLLTCIVIGFVSGVLALGAGNFLGSTLGVRLAVRRGHRWLERVVMITIVCFAVLLWFSG
jgi:uncharacterized membrane protein YfcA